MPFFSLSMTSICFAQSSDGPPSMEIKATLGGLLPDDVDPDVLGLDLCRLRLRDLEDRGSSLLKLVCSFIAGYNTCKTVWIQLI
jgi:hypothetical protein